MASLKGNNVPILGMYLAPAVLSVALWVQYVVLLHVVHQAVWHAQENVRIAFSFLRLSRLLTH